MRKPGVLVTEYFCGGGLYGCGLESELILEGYAMMRSIALDLARAGYSVTVTLDERLRGRVFIPGVRKVLCSREYTRFLGEVSRRFDYAVVIAPSASIFGILRVLEDAGVETINPTSEAAGVVVDKKRVLDEARRAGVKTPETLLVEPSRSELLRAYREFNGKLVIKPRVGDGAKDTYLINRVDELDAALKRIRGRYREVLAQEYIDGEKLSLSIAAGEGGATLLSVNKQYIEVNPTTRELSYVGGCTPVLDRLGEDRLFAEKITRVFRGLKGYVGVDFIRCRGVNYLIEVNPRLTTSYVGLRVALGENPVKYIMNTLAGCGAGVVDCYRCLVEYKIVSSTAECLGGCMVIRNPLSRDKVLCVRVLESYSR